MSTGTTRLVVIMLTVVLVCSLFMLLRENTKSMENLPSLDAVLQMDGEKADSRISGYMEHELMEAWGKPDRSDTETLYWRLPEGAVMVHADAKGKIISCSAKRIQDLPGLRALSSMDEQEMNLRVLGQFADHLACVWNRPDRINRQLYTWKLPKSSPHRAVTVSVDQWGVIESAEFKD